MKVKILSVHNQGNFDEEYVLLEVVSDCDIGKYVLADTTYTSTGTVSNKLRHVYWFPDKDVKKGELVSLRTKAGTNTELTNSSGTKVHRFYWGLKTSVWNDDGDCAVLLQTDDWQHFRATE